MVLSETGINMVKSQKLPSYQPDFSGKKTWYQKCKK